MAVGRQKRDRKETEQASRSKRDQVTRHWWKGIVDLEGPPRHEDIRPAAESQGIISKGKRVVAAGEKSRIKPNSKVSYQQQLEHRIQASRAKGVLLALPLLRDRLQLSLFEKNLLLLGLAPEVNRRYARLYSYLQDNDPLPLPQLDLALKLLCRNDQEWQTARLHLTTESPLLQTGLVSFVADSARPVLMHSIKLSPALVDYALAKPVQADSLDLLLTHAERGMQSLVTHSTPQTSPPLTLNQPLTQPHSSVLLTSPQLTSPQFPLPTPQFEAGLEPNWDRFKVERSLKQELKHLAHRLQSIALEPQPEVTTAMGSTQLSPGTLVLFHGPTGTGKTMAAQLIAQTARTPLMEIDLQHYGAAQLPSLLQELLHQSPTALVLSHAEQLLGSPGRGAVAPSLIHQFFSQRRSQPCLTIFSVDLLPRLANQWQQECDRILTFPLPSPKQRLMLWKQAFPKGTRFEPRLDWSRLSRWRLSGGQIQTIAQDANLYARLAEQKTVTWLNIERAWKQRQRP